MSTNSSLQMPKRGNILSYFLKIFKNVFESCIVLSNDWDNQRTWKAFQANMFVVFHSRESFRLQSFLQNCRSFTPSLEQLIPPSYALHAMHFVHVSKEVYIGNMLTGKQVIQRLLKAVAWHIHSHRKPSTHFRPTFCCLLISLFVIPDGSPVDLT